MCASFQKSFRKTISDIAYDLVDKGNRFVLIADLPGMEREDTSINVTDNEVEISAERKNSKQEDNDNQRKERYKIMYHSTISVPAEIVTSKVTAKMDSGILTIDLPKKTSAKVQPPVEIRV